MRLFSLAAFTAALTLQTAAAQNNPSITDFNATNFDECVTGRDIGRLTKVSNPIMLLGSIAYIGKVPRYDGTFGDGWVKQTMSLPTVSAEAVSPDATTCSKRFEVVADGSVSVIGFNFGATKTDVYTVTVRLIAKQSVAPIPIGGGLTAAWFAPQYQNSFRTVIKSAPEQVKDFFVFDNISIYLLEVQRFRRVAGGITGAIGLISGGSTYKRDEEFKGVKLIVTGDAVHLERASYLKQTEPAAVTTPVAAIPVPTPTQALQSLTPAEANKVLDSVMQAATPMSGTP